MLNRVEFTDDLVTEVADIDRHHRALIGWANRLFDAYNTDEQKKIVERTLAALIDYIAYHFRAEEHAMARVRYDKIDSHKEQHARLSDKVRQMTRDIEKTGLTKAEAIELHFFVEDWVRHHIKHVDGAFARFVKEQANDPGFHLPEPEDLDEIRKKEDTLDNVQVVHAAGIMTADQIRARLKR